MLSLLNMLLGNSILYMIIRWWFLRVLVMTFHRWQFINDFYYGIFEDHLYPSYGMYSSKGQIWGWKFHRQWSNNKTIKITFLKITKYMVQLHHYWLFKGKVVHHVYLFKYLYRISIVMMFIVMCNNDFITASIVMIITIC